MNREEEIKEIAKSYQQKIESQNPSAEAYDYFNAVIYGAQWADEHPKEKMVSMEFACKYWETILTSWGVDRHNILLALANFSHSVNLENKK